MNGMLIVLGLLLLMTMGRPRGADPRIGDPGTGGWEAED